MKIIQRRFLFMPQTIAFGLTIGLVVLSLVCVRIFNSAFLYADSRHLTATISGENGSVNFSPGVNNAVVDFKYVKSGSYASDSKTYDAKIVIRDMPVNKANKELSIMLPIGMAWVDDASGDENVLSQLDVNNHGGVETVNIGQTALDYNFPNSGKRIYHIMDDALSLTLNIKVKADKSVDLGYITNAITVQLSYDGFSESGKVDVNVPTGLAQPGRFAVTTRTKYVTPGETFSRDEDYIKVLRSSFVADQYDTQRLIKQVKVNFHVSNPSVVIELGTTSSTYSLDDSDKNNGNYTLYVNFSSISTGNISPLLYKVIFPDSLSPGDTITINATAETTYWQPGNGSSTIPFGNQQVITYSVLPDGEDVTVGWSSLNPENTGTANNINVNSAIEEGINSVGVLGYGYINNRGSSDSNTKSVHLTFDTSVLGVMGLMLPCSPTRTIDTVHVKTAHNVEKDVAINRSCNAYGLSGVVSYSHLGINSDDYIAELTYELGIIPKSTQLRQSQRNDGSRGLMIIGRRLDASRAGIATVEIYDTSNPTNTTGVATITSSVSKNSGLFLTANSTKVVNAGEVLNFSTTISNYSSTSSVGYIYGVKNPIIYIRSEARDAAGNFLPVSNIKITNGSARGNEDITAKFGQITYEDTETARVYKIDSRTITDGSASINNQTLSTTGAVAQGSLVVSFSIETGLSTPDQTHSISDMIFVQDPTVSSVASRSIRGNPYHLGTGTNNTIRAATNNYYQIRSHQSIGVENAGKYPTSDGWVTWSEGSSPITIGTSDVSMVNMKTSILNNSGVDVPGPTMVYLPIPKKGQNWGSLSYNSQDFNFSTTLTGAISNPDSNHFTIAYGRDVTPSDNGSELEAQDSKFSTNVSGWRASDWASVNCIRVIAMNIPANAPSAADVYDFTYNLKVDNASNTDENTINTWRPVYFQQLVNSTGDVFAGWYKGSYLAVKLSDGKISGKLFVDKNEDGKFDSDELPLSEAGWKVELYDRSSSRIVRSTETDASGTYSFIELDKSENNYYMIVTNKHPIGNAGTTYLFSPKGTISTTDNYNADNQAEGNRTSNPVDATAYINPIAPDNAIGKATYNIGLIEYTSTVTYSGRVVFEDNENQFNTRPESVLVQITPNTGEGTIIEIPTNGSGSWEEVLPKYDSNMNKINYSFNTPELTNYTKTESYNESSHIYNATYTQKTAVLTVHHYIEGTNTEVADSKVTNMYWGQPYSTEQVETANYEYSSVSDDPSGIISGDTTIIYYYKLKHGTVVTHYYLLGTDTSISPDASVEYEYTETYVTSPLEIIPEEYAYYELVSDEPAGYTGIVEAPIIEVTYYYQLKDPSLRSSISISGPESLESTNSVTHYTINYSAHIEDYSGEAIVTLVCKLPYSIDQATSRLDGGIYNEENKTITWNKHYDISTYTDGGDIIDTHDLEVVFTNVIPGRSLLVTAEGLIALSDKNSFSADSTATMVPNIIEDTPNTEVPNTGYAASSKDNSAIGNSVTLMGFIGIIGVFTVTILIKKRRPKIGFEAK